MFWTGQWTTTVGLRFRSHSRGSHGAVHIKQQQLYRKFVWTVLPTRRKSSIGAVKNATWKERSGAVNRKLLVEWVVHSKLQVLIRCDRDCVVRLFGYAVWIVGLWNFLIAQWLHFQQDQQSFVVKVFFSQTFSFHISMLILRCEQFLQQMNSFFRTPKNQYFCFEFYEHTVVKCLSFLYIFGCIVAVEGKILMV